MQKEELNELLTKAKELLKNEVTKISYETWIRDLEINSFEDGNVVLVASNAFQKESIISRYHDLFKNTFNFVSYSKVFTSCCNIALRLSTTLPF